MLKRLTEKTCRQFSTKTSEKISLRILSDTHLESRTKISEKLFPFLTPIDDTQKNIIGLLGDIGAPFQPLYAELIDKISKRYDHVFILAGNHEFYHRNMKDIKDKINHVVSKHDNVTFLDNTSKILFGHKFLGSTLWSHITTQKDHIHQKLGDYQWILNNDKPIDIDFTNNLHSVAVQWLEDELKSSHQKTIIFSHHSPLINTDQTPTALKKYQNSKNNQAFQSDLGHLIKSPIKYWGFGHTHFTTQFKFNETMISSNQTGYDHDKKIYACTRQIFYL